MRYIISIFSLFISCFQSEICAQSTNNVIARKFTQKNGLSSYNIRRIIQDKWGFIWIATQDGVSRFDGRVFLNYSKSGSPTRKLSGSDIKEFIENPGKNQILTLSSEGGIDVINTINGRVEKSVKTPSFGKEAYNISMLKDKNELWIGSSTGVQVFNILKSKFTHKLPLPENRRRTTDFAVRSILQDEYMNLWVCYGGYGVVIYHRATKKILKTIRLSELSSQKHLKEIRIPKGIFLKKGEVLFATSQGLRRIHYDKNYKVHLNLAPCFSIPRLNFENIDWITIESGNSLLVSGYNNLYRFDFSLRNYEVILEASRTYESSWLSSVLCIYQDQSGNTWLGCQEGLGYFDKSETPFNPYGNQPISNVKLDHVFAVSPITNDKILVGQRSGLVEITKQNRKYTEFDKGHFYQHIFTDAKGLVHVSRPDGLFIYKRGKIIPVGQFYSEFLPYSAYSINSHLLVNDTLTILGTEINKGILIWNPVKKTIRSIDVQGSPGLASSIVNNIFRDKTGRIWVLSDYVITILSTDLSSIKNIELKESGTKAPYKLFFDMCEVNGSFFVASYGSGILQVDKYFNVKQVFSTRNGLSNDGVYQVYSILNDELLVTSNNGLSRIDLHTSKIRRYYQNDGLHSNAFEEVSGLMEGGKIYVGGVNGFTVIDPTAFSTNTTPPKLYFTGVEMKTATSTTDTSNILMTAVTIPSDVIQTTIRFAGLNYRNPERTGYAYRIVEESNNWIENGNQASLALISHAPGNYTLEVKASNEEGVYSKSVRLLLYFQPKWYQTWWFKALILMLVAAVAYQYYRFRIEQFKRENEIRRRLASDLHDDLGSTMNGINIYTNLAIMEYGSNRYLSQIKQGAQESISSIRDIIWILDDQKDKVAQFIERIHQFASPLCEVKGIDFCILTDEVSKDHSLGKEEKRNLYLICKEAINNSIKYAEPEQISLSASFLPKNLTITISDNGKGFDAERNHSGNGLNNIRRRAQEIDCNITISSAVATGTTIILSRNK
jgi:ligand-binding sensor domain-containing protein